MDFKPHHRRALRFFVEEKRQLNWDEVGELMYGIDKSANAYAHAQYIRKAVSDTQEGPISKRKFGILAQALGMKEEDLWAIISTRMQNTKSSRSSLTPEQLELCEFFGAAVFDPDKPVQLLMPKRTLAHWTKDIEKSLFKTEDECRFVDAGDLADNVWAEGVSGYLAFDNAVAAMHICNGIVKDTPNTTWMRQENASAVPECLATNSCFISFGLGFSAASRITEAHFEPRLFTIHSIPMPGENVSNRLTDTFRIKREEIDGRDKSNDDTQDVVAPVGKDLALIVRVVPIGNRDRVAQPYFICAGQKAAGTETAGYYLAYHWKELMKLYPDKDSLSKRSMAVVIEYNKPKEPRRDIRIGNLATFMETAEIYRWNDNGERCVAFGEYGPES